MEQNLKNKKTIEEIIEELILYAKINLEFSDYDTTYTRNVLLHEFNAIEPYTGTIDIEFVKGLNTITPIFNEILDLLPNVTDEFLEKIMSILTPRPSEIINKFYCLQKDDPKKATDYFYKLMIKNNYIRLDDINKNLKWDYRSESNRLEITINLSKPEKNNKDIAKLLTTVSTSYPKCRLCISNEGYYGGNGYPARSNIRLIPLKLENENWYFQYSPYAYFNEHSIIINENHTPMKIEKRVIALELAFVDIVPNYFVGCNSDLPIVGGSLLTHEHFQGGNHVMPMMESKTRYNLRINGKDDVEIDYLDWYNSSFCLKSFNKEELLNVADLIITTFANYSDEQVDLIANDAQGRHNTVTTISRKIDSKYYVYIILRNNRTSEKYPDGIFHAHKQYHNIKNEGIGLIEAMGLFILPGRLKVELDLIKDIISSNVYSTSEMIEKYPSLEKHIDFINKLIVKYGRGNTKEKASEVINYEIGLICERILKNTGIFKDNIDGQIALFKLFKTLGMEVINE